MGSTVEKYTTTVDRRPRDARSESSDPVSFLGRDTTCANATRHVALVRDPFARFLSGAAQVELFFGMGWHGKQFFQFEGTALADSCAGGAPAAWFRKTCVYFDSSLRMPGALRVARLEAFVAHVERCGFFDSHLFPMALHFHHAAKAAAGSPGRTPAVDDVAFVDFAAASRPRSGDAARLEAALGLEPGGYAAFENEEKHKIHATSHRPAATTRAETDRRLENPREKSCLGSSRATAASSSSSFSKAALSNRSSSGSRRPEREARDRVVSEALALDRIPKRFGIRAGDDGRRAPRARGLGSGRV